MLRIRAHGHAPPAPDRVERAEFIRGLREVMERLMAEKDTADAVPPAQATG